MHFNPKVGKLPAILLLIAIPGAARAQLDNTVFEDRQSLAAADSGKLFFDLGFLGFSKNNEYFDTIIEGYTLLGYQLHPSLGYYARKNVRLAAGAYLQQDFGNRGFSTVVPTLSLKITKGPMALVFGNIEGSLGHRLIEPLYGFERVLNHRLETGIQLKSMTENLFFDLWLDWQNTIYNNDPEQERFVSGLSVQKKILKKAAFEISIPVQVLIAHRGGQINISHEPLETLMNSAVGAEVQKHGTGWMKAWKVNGFYAYYKDVTATYGRPYLDGSGFYANATMSMAFGLDVMASYWQTHEFLSIQGGNIYPSVSEFDYRVQRENMQLAIVRLLYNREIAKGLAATLRVEPYYDLGFNSFQYSYGFYLQFKDRFFLAKRK